MIIGSAPRLARSTRRARARRGWTARLKLCRPEALRDALRRVNQGTFNSWKASSKRGTLHF